MAYIPKDEDEQQGGMNILAPQNQQQTQQPDGQNQPQNVSGGQSATIGSGSAQQGSQGQSQAPKSKQAKSGMFTNIRKYMDRNKPGAQNMSNKLQSNVSQQNQNIQQAIGKQKNDFMSRVQSNRDRMQGAQQFGQNTLQSAQVQESMPMLQQQQQDLQGRVGQFGDVTDQTSNINQYTGQVGTQQTAYDQAQTTYNNAQTAYQQQAQQLTGVIDPSRIQSGTESVYGRFKNTIRPTYYTQDQLNQAIMAGDQGAISAIDQGLSQDRQLIDQYSQYNPNQLSPQQTQQLQESQNRLNSFQQYRDTLSTQNQAQQAQSGALTQLESYQDQLGRANEQQRLYQNKQQLQGELSEIQARIESAPESLTEDDIKRFNQLRTGVERFDDAILNLSEQKRGVEDLSRMTDALGTNQGRRNLMRQEFGGQGGYTSGQASLDNLILTGDQGAMRELVANSQAQAKQAQDTLQQAFQEGRITQDEMARGTRNIQRDLQEGVTEAQNTLVGGNEQFRELSTQRAEQEAILNDQYSSQEQITNAQAALAGINEQIGSFEGQTGLAERARTGEGTFISELKKKLEGGQGLSEEDMNVLGLTAEQRFNLDPNELLQNLQIDPEQYGIQDVANLTDVARADALARLSGEQAGENRFVNQQMGIDQMDRRAIEARNLSNPEDEFTKTFTELPEGDKQAVQSFLQDLGSAKYESPEQAKGAISSKLNNFHNGGEIAPISGSIMNLVEGGAIGVDPKFGGPVTLDAYINGDDQEKQRVISALGDQNYWSWAGRGRHGVATPFNVIKSALDTAISMYSGIRSTYGADANNALKSESATTYERGGDRGTGMGAILDRVRRG